MDGAGTSEDGASSGDKAERSEDVEDGAHWVKRLFFGVFAGLIVGNKLAVWPYNLSMSYSSDSERGVSEMDIQRMQEFAFVLGRRLSPEQLASALEEWELVCEQRGWHVFEDP